MTILIYEPHKALSKHFKMYEVAKSDTATRSKIDNTPSPSVLIAATATAENILEPIREHFGIAFSPQSWYRGEQLERHINDLAYKQWCRRNGAVVSPASWKRYFALKSHPRGEAVDFEIPGVSNDIVYDWIGKNIPQFDQLIREFPTPDDPMSGWVHVSFSMARNRREQFVIR